MNRNLLASVIAVSGLAGSVALAGEAPVANNPVQVAVDPLLELETYRLWTGRAAGAAGDGADETPTMTIFRPQKAQANGTAVIVAPGGGYIGLSGSLEGRQVADWFASRGITAFVLKYRVGPKARLPIPLSDGVRSVRFVRANAAMFGVDPARVGMIGFSAGGHLAAMTATMAEPENPAAPDPVNRMSSRPDFLMLGYPWLEGTMIDAKGRSQYCTFAGKNCSPQDYEKYAPISMVKPAMPPTFIYHTTTDRLVPVNGAMRFAMALVDSKVPVEIHAFGVGEHGTGLGGADPALSAWTGLLENWLRRQGLLEKKAKGVGPK